MMRIRTALTALALGLLAFGAPGALAAHPTHPAAKAHGQPAANAHKLQSTAPGQTGTQTRGQGAVIAHVASVLGVTPAVLQQDLAAGQTLLQIAGNKYSSADALATALLAPVKSALDAAASSNRLSPAQAASIYTQLHARVVTLVTTPHPALGVLAGPRAGKPAAGNANGKTGVGLAGIRGGFLQTFVTTCKTTPAAFTAAVHTGAGKTLLAICQTTNASVTQAGLVAALTATARTKLDAAVAANKLSPAQESTALANLQTYLNTLVTTPLPAH